MRLSKHARTAPATPPTRKPTVFIGCSEEAKERGILRVVIEGLHESFDPLPWDGDFPASEITLQTLLRLTKEVDAAVLVCAHDDTTNKRGVISNAARDNVYLEYGLFLSTLGMERVSVLWENGVDVPSDVRGLNLRYFKSAGNRSRVNDDHLLRASLEDCVQQVAVSWKNLEPRPSGDRRFSDGGIAVSGTLQHADTRIMEIAAKLEKFAVSGETQKKPFIRFDSNRLALRAYTEGLEAVQNRFWTTTFLTSGFWAMQDAYVLDANKAMLRRIGPTGGSVKRLFLLDTDPVRQIERMKQRMVQLRQAGSTVEAEGLKSRLRSLRDSFGELTALNCEVKVAYDRGRLASRLPSQLKLDPRDSEIALYDDFRLDIFSGGRLGAVSGVNVFSRAYRPFDAVRERVESYFERLWETGRPGIEFIQQLERAYEAADRRIFYSSNWLVFFEFALDPQDQDLKSRELEAAVKVLDSLNLRGCLRRYLDIGTCTGRYPRELRRHLGPEGYILGIDIDVDCVRFARNHPALLADPDPRISFELMDFTSDDIPHMGQFDLITCMLSTLSHFGVNRDVHAGDTLQHALLRTRSLMHPDALFIFTMYSEQACDKLELLNIYQKREMERLVAGTPSHAEMRERLRAAGLRIIAEPKPDLRLDMYVCQPAT